MQSEDSGIDSVSVGDPARFRSLAELEQELDRLPPAPRDQGRVVLLVSRREGGRRECLERARLTPETGMPGDAWARAPAPDPERQLATMQRDVAELLAAGQPLALAGDNLVLDLDLSAENLPTASRLRVGAATLEVTPMPHDGCRKFRARFGADALRFVAGPARRHRNLRGIYLRVVEAGEVAPDDPVEVVSRPSR